MGIFTDKRRAVVGLVVCLVIYLALALPQLDLPGLHNDEAVEGGLQAGQILDGQPITTFREAGLTIAGRTWPMMVQDYIGAFNVYLSIPFLAVFGHSAAALRLYSTALGAVTLALAYGFSWSILGGRAAWMTGLLLAVSPSFVFWQREGLFVTSITAALAVGMLWGGVRWLRTRQVRWAFITGLLAGAGLYAKLLFVWIIGGAAGAAVIVAVARFAAVRRGNVHDRAPHWRSLGMAAIVFGAGALAGLVPLAQYNLQTGGTFSSVGTNLGTSYYGVNNADFAQNLRVRILQLAEVTSGRDHLSYLGGSFENPAWPWAMAAAAVALLAHALWARRAGAGLFLLSLLGLALAQSAFTVSGLFATHFAILAPFWPMVLAAALTLDWQRGQGGGSAQTQDVAPSWRGQISRAMRLAAVVGFAVIWTRDLTVTTEYHRRLNLVGGTSSHTDAIYRLAAELQNYRDQPIYAMDWGFAPQVNMLTRGAIVPLEIFGYSWEPDEGFAARLHEALAQPDAIYVFHTESDTVFPRRAAFEAAVGALGAEAETVTTLLRRDTVPVLEIVRVRP